jgi:hypothetical protein
VTPNESVVEAMDFLDRQRLHRRIQTAKQHSAARSTEIDSGNTGSHRSANGGRVDDAPILGTGDPPRLVKSAISTGELAK